VNNIDGWLNFFNPLICCLYSQMWLNLVMDDLYFHCISNLTRENSAQNDHRRNWCTISTSSCTYNNNKDAQYWTCMLDHVSMLEQFDVKNKQSDGNILFHNWHIIKWIPCWSTLLIHLKMNIIMACFLLG
jgi:hypothetical protein